MNIEVPNYFVSCRSASPYACSRCSSPLRRPRSSVSFSPSVLVREWSRPLWLHPSVCARPRLCRLQWPRQTRSHPRRLKAPVSPLRRLQVRRQLPRRQLRLLWLEAPLKTRSHPCSAQGTRPRLCVGSRSVGSCLAVSSVCCGSRRRCHVDAVRRGAPRETAVS